MGVQVRTLDNKGFKSVDDTRGRLASWLMSEHGFAIQQNGWDEGKYVVRVNKSGFFRHLAGLVFEYKIELSKTDNSIVTVVDSGDIRKQLAALGIAWFIAWPTLVTAGFGMYAAGEFRDQIFYKVETLLTQ